MKTLAGALIVSTVERRAIIFDEKNVPEAVYILLSGVARITCCNRKGQRRLVILVAPGMISGFPLPVNGISYDFRCEAFTSCQIGAIDLDAFIRISLGIESIDFKRMALNYLGRWHLVHLRCSNFMSLTLQERLALVLLELSEDFGIRDSKGLRLGLSARHADLADLVGASRPRITEHLSQFERDRFIARKNRQLVVQPDRIEKFLSQARAALGRGESA
ncbi:MAG TPA: Crp/Fnr family transcriptional regulator [Candidatus Binataceae bacterium]|nr:Crp/Fnr family transcriptional regulator [Candidatus Binataceae bacterium]